MLTHLVLFVWSILNTVIRGYVLTTFWTWFVLTLFPQAPQLAILPAIGLVYLVGLLAPVKLATTEDLRRSREESDSEKKLLGVINSAGYTLAMALTWASGWVIHHFM